MLQGFGNNNFDLAFHLCFISPHKNTSYSTIPTFGRSSLANENKIVVTKNRMFKSHLISSHVSYEQNMFLFRIHMYKQRIIMYPILM